MGEQQWTPAVGMQRALRHLAIRGVIAFAVWTAVIWFITPALNSLTGGWASISIVTLGMGVAGVASAYVLSRTLVDAAGMTGLPVAAPALACGLAVAVLSVLVANDFRPLGDWQYGYAMVVTGFTCSLWLIKVTLIDD